MELRARTPEELEALFEDAFVTRDAEALCAMFLDDAVLVASDEPLEAHGADEIARVATTLWEGGRTYLADPHRVVQARDTALVVAEHAINVVRRGSDGTWQYAISLLALDSQRKERQ